MGSATLLQQNLILFNWQCQLTPVDLFSDHKTAVCRCYCCCCFSSYSFYMLHRRQLLNVVISFPWLPSVLWRCWLGGRKGIRPVKTEWWGAGVVICLERGADLHTAQLMPLPLTVSCFSKIQIVFTFLVPAHPGSPGQRPVKWVCVFLYVTQTSSVSSCN